MEACYTDGKLTVERYLELMVRQHDRVFGRMEGLDERILWRRPAPGEWSIGEIVDHARILYENALPVMERNWTLFKTFAALRQNQPYPIDLDPGARPSKSLQTPGVIGTAWLRLRRQTSLLCLKEDVACAHQKVILFYRDKPANLLGHIRMYDVDFGRINLIQVLQANLYRDEQHYNAIENSLSKIKK